MLNFFNTRVEVLEEETSAFLDKLTNFHFKPFFISTSTNGDNEGCLDQNDMHE